MRRGAESLYFGHFVNKVDAKARLATPARFRRVLDLSGDKEIYCSPSPEEPCLDCGGADFIEEEMAMIAALDPYSPERRSLERMVAAQTFVVSIDGDGRIILPQHMREKIGLNSEAMFVGHGRSFQIWQPENYARAEAEAAEIAAAARKSLRNVAPAGGAA